MLTHTPGCPSSRGASHHTWRSFAPARRSHLVLCNAENLSSDFARFINASGASTTTPTAPSPFLSPVATIQAQLHALQRNDYPTPDSGVAIAFHFATPHGTVIASPGPFTNPPNTSRRVEGWGLGCSGITFPTFRDQLHNPPYRDLIGCESWKLASRLQFLGSSRALQLVQVSPAGQPQLTADFTFCLELQGAGPYKACWLTAGVRPGDCSRMAWPTLCE